MKNQFGDRMARTMQPSVFLDETLFDLEHETGLPVRIVFLVLHTCCDREGRFQWNSNTFRFLTLDSRDVIQAALAALVSAKRIIRYRIGEDDFGFIPGFQSSQHINPRERASALPAPEDGDPVNAAGDIIKRGGGRKKGSQTSAIEGVQKEDLPSSTNHVEVMLDTALGGVKNLPAVRNKGGVLTVTSDMSRTALQHALQSGPVEMNGYIYKRIHGAGIVRVDPEHEAPIVVSFVGDESDPVTFIPLSGEIKLLGISRGKLAEYDELYPDADNVARLKACAQWAVDNPGRRKTSAGINTYIGNWMRNAQNRGDFVRHTDGRVTSGRMGGGLFRNVGADERTRNVVREAMDRLEKQEKGQRSNVEVNS